VFLRRNNIWDRSCRESQNTHFMFNSGFLNRGIYEIKWKNMVEPDRPQMIWRMRFAYWAPKTTNIRSYYVIRIVLHYKNVERTRLSVTLLYIACLVWVLLLFSTPKILSSRKKLIVLLGVLKHSLKSSIRTTNRLSRIWLETLHVFVKTLQVSIMCFARLIIL
jgi:hypothetical protein